MHSAWLVAMQDPVAFTIVVNRQQGEDDDDDTGLHETDDRDEGRFEVDLVQEVRRSPLRAKPRSKRGRTPYSALH